MILSPLQIATGILGLIIFSIFTIVGISIALKYKKTKERVYILVGLTWIGIGQAWISNGIIVIGYLLTNRIILSPQMYLLISLGGYPVTSFIWITAFTEIFYKEKQRIFQIIFGIGETLYEIIFLYVLFTNYHLIADLYSPVDAQLKPLSSIYILFSLCLIGSTGIMMSIKSMRSDQPETRVRGYFLFAAFITFFIGALLDAALEFDFLGIILVRLFILSSAIEFYFGFVLPDFIKKLFKIKT
jgi:hypothetical protein